MEKIIFKSKTHGLCNRLRALVGFQAFAKIVNSPFFILWEKDRACDADISELFNENFKRISRKELDKSQNKNSAGMFNSIEWFDKVWEKNLKETVSWEDFRKVALECLDSLTPLPHIQNKIEHFFTEYSVENIYGLHIRMTDNLDAYKKWDGKVVDFNISDVSQLAGFEKFIKDRLLDEPASRFFLATDNSDIEKEFSEKFPGKILVFKKNYQEDKKKTFSLSQLKFVSKNQRTTSIEDALIDILILSKCKEIAGTYFSSFSKFSAVWGRVPYYEVRGEKYFKTDFVKKMTGINF